MALFRRSLTSVVNARVLTDSSAVAGIVFGDSPAWIAPTVTTPISCGAISRDTMVCRRVITCAAMTTGSTPFSGIEPCAPVPWMVILVCTHVEHTGPASAPIP